MRPPSNRFDSSHRQPLPFGEYSHRPCQRISLLLGIVLVMSSTGTRATRLKRRQLRPLARLACSLLPHPLPSACCVCDARSARAPRDPHSDVHGQSFQPKHLRPNEGGLRSTPLAGAVGSCCGPATFRSTRAARSVLSAVVQGALRFYYGVDDLLCCTEMHNSPCTLL